MKTYVAGLSSVLALSVGAVAAPSTNVNFYNIGTYSLVGAGPTGTVGGSSSIAYNGNTFYLGSSGASATPIVGVTNLLGTPVVGTRFGSPVVGNGVTNLDISGTLLTGVSTNGGASDKLQAFDVVAGVGTARSYSPLATGGTLGGRFDGIGIDPGNVNAAGGGTVGGGSGIAVVGFGSGSRRLVDPLTGGVTDTSVSLFNASGGSGFRDLDFDEATGDVYVRTVNGVQVGVRSGDNGFQTLTGGAGTQQVVSDGSGFAAQLNIAYLGSFSGNTDDRLIMFNDISDVTSGSSFAAINLVQRDGTAVATTFLNADGSASFSEILQTATQTGRFDFSYDNASGELAVLDIANSIVYVFDSTAIPEPASLALLALGGLAMLGRRRRSA